MIIPFVGALLTFAGGTILTWYSMLSDEKKRKYDKDFKRILKQKMETSFGILIDSSDSPETIDKKVIEAGRSREEYRRVIKETYEETKDYMDE